jgi:hypothetical protein
MYCPDSAVTTLSAALAALGLLDKIANPDNFDLNAQTVGAPIFAASASESDKGRLFCTTGNSLTLLSIPRVSKSKSGPFYVNSSFAVVLERVQKQNPGFMPYEETRLTLCLAG